MTTWCTALNLARSLGRAILRSGTVHAAVLLCSCATDDVVVATLPVDTTDCTSNEDCLPIEFCARERCDDAGGRCEVRPLVCSEGPPSCGCDGVSYWNDCLRMQYGTTSSTAGSCANGATCMDENALDCPVLNAACAKLLQNQTCTDDVVGSCWILPVECPTAGPPDPWSACSDPKDCRDICEAIRTGRPYRHDLTHECLFPAD